MRNAIALILLASTACTTVGPDYRAPTASQLSVPDRYNATSASSSNVTSSAELATWWTQLDDSLLNEMIARALGANLDLDVARARLRQARESLLQARSGRTPAVGAFGGVGRTVDSEGNSAGSYSLGADASWEADLFGGVTRSIEAAGADAQASEFDLAAVQVSLISDIVANYVEARFAQQRESLARRTLAIAVENLEIAEWRLRAGLVSSIDVEQARGARAQTAATIPTYQQNFSSAAHRLGVLTGHAPASLMSRLNVPKPIPEAPEQVAAGIPADTLRQRPDVQSAERNLAAQTARIGIAKANLYPNLRLTGNIGTSALSIGSLVDLITGSLFATLSQTIFDGGRTRSEVRGQEAAAEGAFATYKKAVLTALEGVENGLVALRTAEQRETQFEEALDAARNQAILARSQYRAGLSDFQTLLEAERALIAANEGLLSTQADQTLAVVQLYRALGGGWNPPASSQGFKA